MSLLSSISYKNHLIFAFSLRILFIAYGIYHDRVSSVPYTDVDYSVFTDAARHLLTENNNSHSSQNNDNVNSNNNNNGGVSNQDYNNNNSSYEYTNSPYLRHTYRYSPVVAWLMIPNLLIHPCAGKVLFAAVDIAVGLLIRGLVAHAMRVYAGVVESGAAAAHQQGTEGESRKSGGRKSRKLSVPGKKTDLNAETQATIAMITWLYCPLTIAIATRGNCDSIAALLILATLYQLQCKSNYFLAGIFHGFSVHFRLYPIVYSLAMFMSISSYSWYSIDGESTQITENTKAQKKTIFKVEYLKYLWPNKNQLLLISGCLLSLVALTGFFYYLYGYKFLYETYIFHLVRKDTRHNFSLFFYLQYLTAGIKNIGVWQKVLILLPQLILLLVFSIRYGLNRFTLSFSLLAQTIVMIAYNTVLTSQYFVWIMAVLPLCLWQISVGLKGGLFMIAAWFIAQGAWLLPAYYLEFQGKNTYWYIWVQSVSFFCVNIWILGRFILNFMPSVIKSIKYE